MIIDYIIPKKRQLSSQARAYNLSKINNKTLDYITLKLRKNNKTISNTH